MRERIGILGGSFNPFHLGHLFMGCSALEAFHLNRVLLMPCAVSPFKIGESGLLPGEERLEMIRESVQDDPRFEPCDIEIRRGGVSYAVDSVAEIQRMNPTADLFFIIGMDSLLGLSRWHDAQRLLALCSIITLARPGTPLPAPDTLGFPLETAQKLLKQVISGRMIDLSSSEIRRRIAQGLPIRYLVSRAVEKRIREHGWYAAVPPQRS